MSRITGAVLLLVAGAPVAAGDERLLLLADPLTLPSPPSDGGEGRVRGPVVLGVEVSVDGKPLPAAWGRYLDRLFADLDRDGDGLLGKAEAARAPGIEFVTSFLQGALNLEAAAVAGPFDRLDADGDGSVRRPELVAFYERCGFHRVLVALGPERPRASALTDALFHLLDRDGDRKLSQEELKEARAALHLTDLNEDEWLTPEELLLHRPAEGESDPPRATLEALGLLPLGDTFSATQREKIRARYPLGDGRDAGLAASLAVRLGGARSVELKPGGRDGISTQRIDESALRLAVGGVGLDVQAGAGGAGRVRGLHAFYRQQFEAADADRRGFVTVEQVADLAALTALFKLADRDGDGKLTDREFNAFLDLHALGAESFVTLTVSDQSPGAFGLVDEDGDARLSLRELHATRERLGRLDRNGDGRVGRAELPRRLLLHLTRGTPAPRPAGASRPAPRPVKARGPDWFRKMDRNGDGVVSPREFLGTLEDFEKFDRDGDGLLDPDEAARSAATR